MLDPVTGNSYFKVLTDISKFFHCNLLTRIQKNGEYRIICASSEKSIQVLIDYLAKFPLFSSKFLDYQDWKSAANYKFKRLDLNVEDLNKIAVLKAGMNRNRIFFN